VGLGGPRCGSGLGCFAVIFPFLFGLRPAQSTNPNPKINPNRLLSREGERGMASRSEPENPSPNIYIPPEWSEAADCIAYDSVTSPPPIAIVCGAKNCGKSTFSRYLLNILLQRYKKVGYLDTDVGQPEFSPPDLTIPHLKTPERCLFFGDVSSKRNPTTYLNYIFALYDYYQKEYCLFGKSASPAKVGLPLVVNTPGWVKVYGPNHVVKINISAESKNLPCGAFWVLVQKDARLLRDTVLSSNLNITTIKELAHVLASHLLMKFQYLALRLESALPGSEIFYSLNATIVGLAVSSERTEDLPWCVVLVGIVRGIDTFKGLVYVITPVPRGTLEKVNLLLQGFIQIPTGCC
ncbi:Pre-mRNA cleavage complex II protein family, partial [Prunus dulcis]